MNWLTSLMYLAIGLIVGAVATFFIMRYVYGKQIKDNPPITEKQIRIMFESMGQKPSEAKIQQVLRNMGIKPNQGSDKNNLKK